MTKRLTHLDRVEAHVFPWGQIKWLHNASTSAEELTVGEVIINPGHENAFHGHPNCEEVLVLLSGELVHSCGDEEPYSMTPGTAICIPRRVKHNARCVSSSPARMIVAYSSAMRETSEE